MTWLGTAMTETVDDNPSNPKVGRCSVGRFWASFGQMD